MEKGIILTGILVVAILYVVLLHYWTVRTAKRFKEAEASFKAGKERGYKEVVEWMDFNCIRCQNTTDEYSGEYLGFHKKSWQAYKKKLGIE